LAAKIQKLKVPPAGLSFSLSPARLRPLINWQKLIIKFINSLAETNRRPIHS